MSEPCGEIGYTGIPLDTIPFCCVLLDKSFRILDTNIDTVKFFRLNSKQEFIDRFFVLSPKYQSDGRLSLDAAKMCLRKALNEGRCVFEWTHQFPDGTHVPTLITAVTIKREDDGIILAYIQDLREQKRLMANSEKQNNLLKSIYTVSAIMLDPDVEYYEKNLSISMKMIAESVNVDRVCIWRYQIRGEQSYFTLVYEWLGDTIASTDTGFITDFSIKEIMPDWDDILSQGKCINGIARNMSPSVQAQLAQWGILSVFVSPVFLNDEFWGCVGFDDCQKERSFTENEALILRSSSRLIANTLVRNEMTHDIRASASRLEAMVDEAREASRAKSDFLAKMSHEIRTPINAIIGMAELALREKEIETSHKHIFTIKQAGANLLSIINDILDFSKIESGRLEINPDYYQFSSLMNDVISIIRMRTLDSRLRFVVNIDSRIPGELYGDETRIRQILINTLSNAVKYTEDGFVSFTVMGDIDEGENTINLSIDIMDSGRGMKPEDMEKLFGDFVQLDTENNKNIEGTGLGLAITWNLLKAMGGDIQAFSEYGKGSIFTITLPQKFRSAKRLASVQNLEDMSVLVFERRDIYCNSIVTTVDNLGVNCDFAMNDTEFREKLAAKTYSFIFIALALYTRYLSIIEKYGASSKIVILTEFGEAVTSKGRCILAMPAHSISVANILNGELDIYSYNESIESIMNFTAPDAKVLIVDDIKTNLTVAEGLLLPYGMQVDLCKSGIEAINAVKNRRYDLVFMDHWMPKMDGVEATKLIRAMGSPDAAGSEDKYYRDLPIIALTANAISEARKIFAESGFNGFLEKPIDTIKLNMVLEKWIPAEKQKSAAPKEAAPAVHPAAEETRDSGGKKKEEAASIENLKISGIKVSKGIAATGGTGELYLKTLNVFYQDGIEKLKELKECLDGNDIPLYTIYVHAIKSAAANIGAEELSKTAFALEMAGKNSDLGYIETHNPQFVVSLESILTEIKKNLSELSGKKGETKGSFDTEAVKAGLIRLKQALETFDARAMNSVVDELLKLDLTDNLNNAIQNVSANILMAEYDEALKITESLMKVV